MRRTHSNRIIAVLVTVLGIICMALPAAAETIALSGVITEVSEILTPPAPFSGVVVGDTWTLSYTFDVTGIPDVDSNALVGNYRNAVTAMTLTIGSDSVTGIPEPTVPGGFGSVIGVNLTSGFADYVAQVGLPISEAYAQVALDDDSGAPFDDDSLPPELPMPLADYFPDLREFSLREPGTASIFLKGEIGELPPGPDDQCQEAAEAATEAALDYEDATRDVSRNCPGDPVDCDGAKLSATNALTQLMDAHQMMLDVCLGTAPPSPAGPPTSPGDIVITEFMANPSSVSDSVGEWFEIYNPTSTDFDLNGLVVGDDGFDIFTINTPLFLPAGGFVVLGRNGDQNINGGVPVDFVYSNFVLGNSGDEIEILNGTIILDKITYNDAPSGASAALKNDDFDAISNDDESDWCASSSPLPGGDAGTPVDFNDSCE